ncbi:MAG TPA: hypothetical protein VMW42_14200, partial [Desulfatiglandales bacterium]|nr:hypothetical protein [Desulfatiglandales bacterium]
IVKVIRSGVLSSDQAQQAMKELSVKCRIYGKGCIKRGRTEEGYFYLSLTEKLANSEEILYYKKRGGDLIAEDCS